MIWRSKFRFKIVIWRGSDKYSIQNALLKLWSLKPATCTQPAPNLHPTCTTVVVRNKLLLPSVARFRKRQLTCSPVAPSHPGVHLCAKALGFFLQLQHSSLLWEMASVRLGLIQSSRMHNMDAQVSGLLSVCLLNEVAFSRNLENWYLPMCNFRSPWILEGRPQCQITFCR